MYQKVKAYVKEHHMLNKQDKVIVGVSGGADSICLLFMLLELQKEVEFSITAVHIHHGLRGEAADADEEYVKQVCKEKQVELFVFHENVREYADRFGYTEEEAGRELRRHRFCQVMDEQKGTKIALAHHKNDNIETFLWNLCRGTGLKGMEGIQPVNGVWIRPLLCLQRQEIEEYLKKQEIVYCIDETNYQDDYTRNRIRNHVVPYLEGQINSQSVNHIAEAIEHMRMVGAYIDEEMDKYRESCVSTKEKKGETRWVLHEDTFISMPKVFQKKMIHNLLGEIAGKKKDIENVHINIVENLFHKQVGRKCDLPYGIQVRRIYEGLEFAQKMFFEEKDEEKETENKPQIRVFERTTEMGTFPENPYTKWFDYDIIKGTVEIRHRKSGDYIVIDKNGKTQKLKQYFVNEKIPQEQRDQIWLVADGQNIMWIVGYRQSQAYQITDNTKRIIEIQFEQ